VIAWLVAEAKLLAWLRRYADEIQPASALRWWLEAYLLGFVIFTLIPLDLTLSVTELFHKYERGQVILIPFTYTYREPMRIVYQFFADIVTFVPVGALVMLVVPLRFARQSPVLVGIVCGGAIALVIECAQLLVLSRYTDTTDIVLGSIGAGLGAWLMARSRHGVSAPFALPDRRWRFAGFWSLVIAGYSVFLMIGFWYPFDWTTDRAVIREGYEGFFRVPFLALYRSSSFNALRQVLLRMLLFAPLGVMTARMAVVAATRTGRTLVTLLGLGYACALAVVIEGAQIAMPSKVADATEIPFYVIGAIAGCLGARRMVGNTEAAQAAESRRRLVFPVGDRRR
jgi:glycopeptide antibiotics resistance protein